MKNEDRLETIKGVYEEPRMSERQVEMMKQNIEKAKRENAQEAKRKNRWVKYGVAAAATAALVILPNTSASVAHAMEQIPVLGRLVEVITFRDYQYEDERNLANIEVPEIVTDATTEAAENVQESLQQSIDEINAEIQELTDKFVAEFEENLQAEEGYQNIGIYSEIINTTEDYFTLKLVSYQVSGSGTQWNDYYTIDLTTGERLRLSKLFAEGTDYITPISENIKEQMAEQMAADEKVVYWLNDEIEEWNFKQITDETAFYVNENGNIVISFNEGDVAPMYMGVVTFEIPAEVTADIRR